MRIVEDRAQVSDDHAAMGQEKLERLGRTRRAEVDVGDHGAKKIVGKTAIGSRPAYVRRARSIFAGIGEAPITVPGADGGLSAAPADPKGSGSPAPPIAAPRGRTPRPPPGVRRPERPPGGPGGPDKARPPRPCP